VRTDVYKCNACREVAPIKPTKYGRLSGDLFDYNGGRRVPGLLPKRWPGVDQAGSDRKAAYGV
jgi:hypothetical protein